MSYGYGRNNLPPSNAEIDYSHPLMRGCNVCLLPHPAYPWRDRSQYKHPITMLSGAAWTNGGYQSNSGICTINNAYIPLANSTLICRFISNPPAKSSSLYSTMSSAANGYDFKSQQNSNTYKYGITTIGIADNAFNVNTIYQIDVTIAYVVYGNYVSQVYVNGSLNGQMTIQQPNAPSLNSMIVAGMNFNGGNLDYMSGIIKSLYHYSRALSPAEIEWLYQEPYAFVQAPGRNIFYSFPSGIILTGTAIAVANALGATKAATRVTGIGVSASIASGSTAAKTKVIGTSVSASNALGTTKAATRLIGAATSAAVANGVANAKTLIIGTCIAASNAIGNVKAKTILVGTAVAAAIANGALRTSASITFVGTAIAACVASGALKASTRIQGTAISATNALGSITAKTRIIGTVISAAVGAGVMKGKTRITGTCVAASNALGTINAKARLIGTVTSAAVSNGVLKAKTYIIGTCVAASNAMGEMNAVTRITGTAIAACIAISRFLNSIIFNPVTKSARGDGVTKSARGDIITKSGRKN